MERFKLGQIVKTKAIREKMREDDGFFVSVLKCFDRFRHCNWGDIEEEDKRMNDLAVKNGDDRILAAYNILDGERIYIITEWDRSVTTIMLPEDY